jgi:phosphatidate cytidylyltransferase
MSKNLKKRIYTSIILFLLLFLMSMNNFVLGYFIMIISIFSILEFFKITQIIFHQDKIKKIFVNLFFLSYIFAFSSAFLILSNFLHLKILIFFILITCVSSDIGGYLFGKIFKGNKLTKISPNKTISGAIGSLILSATIVSLLIYYLTKDFNSYILIVGCMTSIACQIGDLFFSYLKRKASLKDTSNFLPGHGGILDRVDGILLGMPIGFLSLLMIY